ncbi:MAG: chorismate mutase [Dehalococcoidia bacterium]
MRCRGIRGATTVNQNSRESILQGTSELLDKIIEANRIEVDEVACVFFTTTTDLDAEFPALAARRMGWTKTALICGHEMDVPGSLARCIRILILYNTEKSADEIEHIYINGAENLRNSTPSS